MNDTIDQTLPDAGKLMRALIATIMISLLPVGASAGEGVDFRREVKPILVARCFKCHSQLEAESELRLDSISRMLTGGVRGPAIIKGDSKSSLLIKVLRGEEEDLMMPSEGPALPAAQIAIIARWIDEGAEGTDDVTSIRHWAYQRPVLVPAPTSVRSAWNATELDRWVAAGHVEHQLQPVPVADRRTLIRRAYLDLVGFPPTIQQVNAFLSDETDTAYARMVDELLASERYGERWGRHWMDIWRYSDWSGYKAEVRNSQKNIWHWRDWIIRSLNQDKSYATMVQHMLAGDEIAPTDPDALRATGYLVRSWYKFNRNTWLDKTIEHSGKAFLGMTIGCAKCHDHMYDPISQRAYYQYRAIFETHDVRDSMIPADSSADGQTIPRVFDKRLQDPTYVFLRGDDRTPDKEEVMLPGLPGLFDTPLNVEPIALPVAAYYPGSTPAAQQRDHQRAKQELQVATQALTTARKTLASKMEPTDSPSPAPALPNPMVIVKDSFETLDETRWKPLEGNWKAVDGQLTQDETGSQQRRLELQTKIPQDFELLMEVTIRGGEKWKSVGFDFDNHDERALGFYISAVQGGAKTQFLLRDGADTEYLTNGVVPYPFKQDEKVDLRFLIKGSLANVYINGTLIQALQFKRARVSGALQIWTFDCDAAFDSFAIATLAADTQLKLPADIMPPKPAVSVADAERAVEQAEAEQRVKQRQLEFIVARSDADNAKYHQAEVAADGVRTLSEEAYRAEQAWQQARFEKELTNAEHAVAAAREKFQSEETDANKKELEKFEKQTVTVKQKLTSLQQKMDSDKVSETYSSLGPLFPQTSSGRRQALANWIVARDNPLTARVAVNHIWLRHFGVPLVPTVFDFGLNGKPPSHPELLDYLATELMENQWSMKHIHRLIMNSRTYQLRSSGKSESATNLQQDPDNLYLWRMNSRRMEAEVVRDSVLHVSGALDLKMGGPEIPFAQGMTNYRRSVYFQTAYEKQMVFLQLFDVASPEECYQRKNSIIPQQALAMANSPLAKRQSRVLAKDLLRLSKPDEIGSFVKLSFEHILGRPPTGMETQTCETFIQQQTDRLSNPKSLTQFTKGNEVDVLPSADPRVRACENLILVLLNHNEFITIR